MARSIITLTDTNAPAGHYEFDLAYEGVEPTKYTAARLVGAFLQNQFYTAALIRQADRYAEENGISIHHAREIDSATVTITLTDTDELGHYTTNIDVKRSEDGGYYTGALLIADYILKLLPTEAFLTDMWAFADFIVSENEGASIENDTRSTPSDGTAD